MIDRQELRRLCKAATQEKLTDEVWTSRCRLSVVARTAVPALLDALEAAEAREMKLRSYMLGDATCPCCQRVDMCLPGCTFSSDAPEAADRMADVRAALAETAP